MKKLIALVLVLMLFVPSALAANYEIPGYYNPPVANEGQYPFKEEGVKLTYWMPINSGAAMFISSYEENPVYQMFQENTGIDIEFIHPAAGTDRESFQLLMAGEMPDIIQMGGASWYQGGLPAMYEDGVIVDLTPYLEEYAPQYLETAEGKYGFWHEGKMLAIQRFGRDSQSPWYRMNINKDWMLEAGLESEPMTRAEYEQYFQWIIDNKPGVTPLYLPLGNITNDMQVFDVFMPAFDMTRSWHVTKEDPTKVAYWANAEGYKDFLAMLKDWNDKGYLGKDFLSLTGAEAEVMFDAGKIGAICGSVDATYNRLSMNENSFTLTNCPYMTLTEDQIIGAPRTDPNLSTGNLEGWYLSVISTDCDNVPAALAFMNYGFTREGAIAANFGIEGEAWNLGEDGVPKYTELMTKNPEGQTHSNVSYSLKTHCGTRYTYPDDVTSVAMGSTPIVMELRTKWNDLKNEGVFLTMPTLALTAEETTERTELLTQVDLYAKEMMIKFINGTESLDNYDAYVKNVEEYGLARATEITQAALDRLNADLAAE